MSQHLKTRVFRSLECIMDEKIPASKISTHHTRGVRYFTLVEGIDAYCGIVHERKEGRKYRKHIIARRYSGHRKVYQLYTYHFPKTWSAACVANRELIKEAQRRAHALEHDTSRTGLEWHLRFLNHYFKVFKGHAKPEPGMKPYSRFYQYTYVAIYRELQAAAKKTEEPAEDITFEPIELNPLQTYRQCRKFVPVIMPQIDQNPMKTQKNARKIWSIQNFVVPLHAFS